MVITIINCHVENRGDEAAIHALVDEITELYPRAKINLLLRGDTFYPNMPNTVHMDRQFVPGDLKSIIAYYIAYISKGRVKISSSGKRTFRAIEEADIILHAPGGPSIGDTYYEAEPTYLRLYDLASSMRKPYMFYAPSMGPFIRTKRNDWRRKILNGAKAIVLRDPISAEHVRNLIPDKTIYQTLDSALQHDIDVTENNKKLKEYSDLRKFIESHKRCVGITITDLLWHPIHSKNREIVDNIKRTFTKTIEELVQKGYGIVFIPQLYGSGNDYDLMKAYCTNETDFFVLPADKDKYDTYFQQYLIGQLYAVIGMRYHSNIFSAKMGTPFISVSYEQKMQGFMEKMKLLDYCIKLEDLNARILLEKFNKLEFNYKCYKQYLFNKHNEMKAESYRTTEILLDVINQLDRK